MKNVAGVSQKFRKYYVVLSATDEVEVLLTSCGNCGHLFRWVEFRPPNYCPECGHKFDYGEKYERNRSV